MWRCASSCRWLNFWIKESYNRAFAKASDDDRAMCLQMLEQWVQGRRE